MIWSYKILVRITSLAVETNMQIQNIQHMGH